MTLARSGSVERRRQFREARALARHDMAERYVSREEIAVRLNLTPGRITQRVRDQDDFPASCGNDWHGTKPRNVGVSRGRRPILRASVPKVEAAERSRVQSVVTSRLC
jgi:hypothetical protein